MNQTGTSKRVDHLRVLPGSTITFSIPTLIDGGVLHPAGCQTNRTRFGSFGRIRYSGKCPNDWLRFKPYTTVAELRGKVGGYFPVEK